MALTGANALGGVLECDFDLFPPGRTPTIADGAKLFTFACIKVFGCEHSLAPTISGEQFIGACLNCPTKADDIVYGGCLLSLED